MGVSAFAWVAAGVLVASVSVLWLFSAPRREYRRLFSHRRWGEWWNIGLAVVVFPVDLVLLAWGNRLTTLFNILPFFLMGYMAIGALLWFLGSRAHEPEYRQWKKQRRLPPRPDVSHG